MMTLVLLITEGCKVELHSEVCLLPRSKSREPASLSPASHPVRAYIVSFIKNTKLTAIHLSFINAHCLTIAVGSRDTGKYITRLPEHIGAKTTVVSDHLTLVYLPIGIRETHTNDLY